MQSNNRKIHILPNSIGLLILEVIVLIADIVFLSLLAVLDLLPMAVNIAIFVILILLTVLAFKLLNSRKKDTNQRKAGAVLSVLLILFLGIGCFYLFTTYTVFHNMSDEDKQYESYYVVALKHGDYKKLSDIEGKTVFTYESNSSAYKDAQEILKKEADVTYEEVSGYMKLQTTLIDGKNNEHDRIIFLSSSNYDMICEYAKEFEDHTRIIHQITVDIQNKDLAKRVGITKEPFNVYISGIDTYGGIGKVSRSDVNMIMSVNPQTKEILLTSIPRDAYVTLHSYGKLDKLTHSGIYGIDETVSTVEDWLDLDINYYIRVNFTSLQDIVDAIGGIDVTSPQAFKSSVSEYSYTEGINHLGGEAALFFARERKSFSDGDQERIKNQQRVLSAILEKVTGSSVILTKYTQLLNAVGDEIQTNLTQKDISALVRMQLSDLGNWTIDTISITGKGTYDATYSMGSRKLYVLVPDDASVEEAQGRIEEILKD